jgi:GNAT superfamily N-acetyltransferase
MQLRPFRAHDAGILAAVSRRAFENDTRYGAPEVGGPPGYDSASWQAEMASQATAYLVIEVEGEVIGGIILFVTGSESWVGRMFIDPSWQGRGFGLATLAAAESQYPDLRRWSLETPPWNCRNHLFYERAGYTRTGLSNSGDYLFEKVLRRPSNGPTPPPPAPGE